jgi:hypothetical protein
MRQFCVKHPPPAAFTAFATLFQSFTCSLFHDYQDSPKGRSSTLNDHALWS